MRLSALTVVWNLIVGGTGVAIAVSTGSLSLIGFGINAVVDSSVSVLLSGASMPRTVAMPSGRSAPRCGRSGSPASRSS